MKDIDLKNIPVFDLNDFDFSANADPGKNQDFADALGKAFHHYGFVRLKNHGIQEKFLKAAEDSLQGFFALSQDVKDKYLYPDAQYQVGYVANVEVANGQQEADLKEHFMICRDAADLYDHLPRNPKIAELPDFNTNTYNLYGQFEGLIQKILEPLALHLELEQHYFAGHTEQSHNMMRMIHYPAGGNAASHTDMSMLTLLRAEKPGLYVTTRDGHEIEVVAEPGELILNGGKSLAALTNNYFKPSVHRVDVKSKDPRQTIVFFAHMNPDYMLDILPTEKLRNGDWGLAEESWFQRLSQFPLSYDQYSQERLAKNFSSLQEQEQGQGQGEEQGNANSNLYQGTRKVS